MSYGYWGKQGPEFLDHRLALYGEQQRMVLGANTFPTTVVSTTLEGPLDWPDAALVSGDAVEVVARLKEESEVPLRSHGSLSMNRALPTHPPLICSVVPTARRAARRRRDVVPVFARARRAAEPEGPPPVVFMHRARSRRTGAPRPIGRPHRGRMSG